MKVEYTGPFIETAIQVLQAQIGTTPERGALSVRNLDCTNHQINIVCGVGGDVLGRVIYGMSVITADRLASVLTGTTVVTFDQVAASALGDLFKNACRSSEKLLAASGYMCETTPPTIIRGNNVRISNQPMASLIIPVRVQDIGEIEICTCLCEASARAA